MRQPLLALAILASLTQGTQAQVSPGVRSGGKSVVAVFYSDPASKTQSDLRTYAQEVARVRNMRVVECNIHTLELSSDRLPPALKEAIERDGGTIARWGKLDSKMLVLQFYNQVASSGEIVVNNFGKPIFILEGAQLLVISDVAMGKEPKPRVRAAPMTGLRLLFAGIGVICGLLLFVCMLLPDEKCVSRFFCFLVPAVVMLLAGLANPQAAADFVVMTGVIPFFALSGVLLLGAFIRAFGLWIVLFSLFRWRR